MNFAIVACFNPPINTTPTIASTPSPTTTTTIAPTTTTMNYCVEEKGMNQPLTIPTDKVTSDQPFEQTTPSGGDINPTTTTPGLDFPSTKPTINVTLDQPAALTVIYVPTDRPNQPTNVDEFTVTFVYPNGTTSEPFSSTPSSITSTPSETTSTLPTPSGVVPPSSNSPQIDLPPNFEVPEGTKVVITITSTDDNKPPTGVCHPVFFFSLI